MKRLAAVLLLSFTVLLTGCHKPEVKFTDMGPSPTATVSGQNVTIHLGSDLINSASWIHAKANVRGQTVYVFGYRSLRTQSWEYVVHLPASVDSKSLSVIWIDPDGSQVSIPIKK
jgi:hypothetical protein